MHTKQTVIAFIVFVLVTSSSCSRHKEPPVDQRCSKSIEQVSQLLKEKSKDYSKADVQRIQNLIKAAKIQQQHGRFNTCVDKMNRALTLMKEDTISKQSRATAN